MPVNHYILVQIIDNGQSWLESEKVNKPDWSAGFRLYRGILLKKQGNLSAAQPELELALKLAQLYPDAPGHPIAGHKLELADLFYKLKDYEKTRALAEEVLIAPDSSRSGQWRAATFLGFAQVALENLPGAKQAAAASLELALTLESPGSLATSWKLLAGVHRVSGDLEQAVSASYRQWRICRKIKTGSVVYLSNTFTGCVRVRLLQTRQALGLAVEDGHESEDKDRLASVLLLPEATTKLAHRRLASAIRFSHRGLKLALLLDAITDNGDYQNEISLLEQEINRLKGFLGK